MTPKRSAWARSRRRTRVACTSGAHRRVSVGDENGDDVVEQLVAEKLRGASHLAARGGVWVLCQRQELFGDSLQFGGNDAAAPKLAC